MMITHLISPVVCGAIGIALGYYVGAREERKSNPLVLLGVSFAIIQDNPNTTTLYMYAPAYDRLPCDCISLPPNIGYNDKLQAITLMKLLENHPQLRFKLKRYGRKFRVLRFFWNEREIGAFLIPNK